MSATAPLADTSSAPSRSAESITSSPFWWPSAARTAASRLNAIRSAATKPGVRSATSPRSTSSASGTSRSSVRSSSALVGPSGSGKSTLVRILSTLLLLVGLLIYMQWPTGRRLQLHVVAMAVGALAKPPAVLLGPLLLAYAQRHPQRVSAAVITAVTTTRRSEIDWLYHGLARFFPAEWDRFSAGARGLDDDLVVAYARLLAHPDASARAQAARDWHAWEDATISLEPQGRPNSYSDRPLAAMLARARIITHYFANGAFLDEGVLLREAGRLAGIPATLLHGRLDLGSPVQTAWELARAWPGAELEIVDDSGHTGSELMTVRKRAALDRYAAALERHAAS